MPFLLTFIGLLMIVTGVRNTHVQFARQVQSDFTGPGNFTTWIVALGALGSLGYIEKLRTFSHYFMALVIIGFILSNKGFFAKFTAAMNSGPVAPTAMAESTATAAVTETTAAKMTPEEITKKIETNSQGAFGQSTVPGSAQAKFNGWMNYGIKSLFGLN